MSESKNKKISPVLLFGVGFILIFIMMFIANFRKSQGIELPSPPGGIEDVYTLDNHLVVISSSNEIYLWDWDKLDVGPEIKTVNSEKLLLSHSDNLVMIPLKDKSSVMIKDFRTGNKKRGFNFSGGWKYLQMAQSRNGEHVTIVQSQSSAEGGRFRFDRLSEEFDNLEHIITIEEERFSVFAIAVSDDGGLIAAIGEKDKEGWIVVIDVNKTERLWSKKFIDSSYLTEAVFDMDGKSIFVGGEGKYLFLIEAATGVITRQFKIESKVNQSFNEPRITAVKISLDGSTVAACINPDNKIQFWNILSGKQLGIKWGTRGLNNLSFSPDSTMYLTAGRVHGGNFKVRKVPE